MKNKVIQIATLPGDANRLDRLFALDSDGNIYYSDNTGYDWKPTNEPVEQLRMENGHGEPGEPGEPDR